MQNSVSEGVPFEGATTSYNNEGGTSTETPAPGYNAEAPAFSYDEVFPALSQPTAAPRPTNTGTIKMRVGTSYVSQVFVISRNERKLDNSEKFGESDNFDTCKQIMAQTNTKIEISAGKDKALTFLVSGKATDVQDAKKHIFANFQTPYSTTINVQKEYHKNLLGKGGLKLKDLERATGCKISFPNINDPSDVITVTGPKEGVEKAVHKITLDYNDLSKKASERVSVPKIYHPFMSGGYDEILNQICTDLNVKVHIPPPSVDNDEISIAGEKEGVTKAKERVLAIYRDMESKCNHVSVEVTKAKHKYIFGTKGGTIADILKETGVSVEIPPANEDSETITLRGPQEKLGSALTLVYAKANSVTTSTVTAPAWLHKRLRGKKGVNIRRIVQDSRIHIEFKEDQDSILIEGPPEEVAKVKEELEKETKDYLSSLVCDELKVDARFAKHIIGKGGANVNRLKDETGVDINITEDMGFALLKFEGTPNGVEKVRAELVDLVAKLENEKEKDLVVDHRFIPSMIGKSGEKIREIKERFNNVTITFPSQADKGEVVKIRGPKGDVDQCITYLKQHIKELEAESYSIQLPIFKQFHKFIIGKAGANIRKIRDETGTKINLPNEGETSDVIIITGREDSVIQAKERILKIQNEMANIIQKEIAIPPKFYNSLIGVRGKLIQAISDECGGVQIKFPDQNSKSDKVTIRGPKEDVDRAVQQLEDLKNEREATAFTEEIKANPQHHKFLIGKKGTTITRIRQNTGAKIIFPSDKCPDPPDIITIMGKPEQIEAAKKELLQLIKEVENTIEDEMVVDQEYHKHFIAKRAAIINQISDECGGVVISFPRSDVDSNKVTLKGSKACIELAKKKIEETIKELQSKVTVQLTIPQMHHRTVLGKRGARVQNITSDFNVQIKFPDRFPAADTPEGDENFTTRNVNGDSDSRSCDIITITGQAENCEKAKEALLSYVPITIEVPVAFDLHKRIIGKSGVYVRELKDRFEVLINMSPTDQPVDIITITGPRSNVEAAKQAILDRVAEFEKDEEERALKSFKVTVEIDPEYHRQIIGKKGQVINKIRDDFGVQITLPNRDDPDNKNIIITGYEEKALAARDHILSFVKELTDRFKEEIEIDSRVHSRLIGPRGAAIRRYKTEHNVDVKFSRPTDANPDLVTVSGATQDAVRDAVEELLNQAEEYMQDLEDNYVPPRSESAGDGSGGPADGFVVRGGPWETGPQPTPDTASITDFPTFGAQSQGPQLTTWGPRR